MQANKLLYRKYFPNSRISDSDLELLLNSLKTAYPGMGIKSIFREMQQDNVFWNNFKAKYPHANISKFHLDITNGVKNIYYGDHWAWGESKHNVSAFSKEEVAALGKESTFPRQLMLNNERYPVPGISFSESVDDIARELVTLDIYVTPTDSFQAKMRDVFKKTCIFLE